MGNANTKIERKINKMNKCLNIFVGFDQKEAIAYHAFSQSIIQNSSIPVSITPLAENNLNMYKEKHHDGTNKFTYSRFLVPYLMGFNGWAVFADGDMICLKDIKKLIALASEKFAVQVIKHDYKTRYKTKYFGQKNEDYPRKNWSSLIIWNCSHEKNKVLTPNFIEGKDGAFLHRFKWLDDHEIGKIKEEWNWLAIEYPEKTDVNLIHYTFGTPCFKEYERKSYSNHWYSTFKKLLEGFYKKEILK